MRPPTMKRYGFLMMVLGGALLLSSCAVPRRNITTSTSELHGELPQNWKESAGTNSLPITNRLLDLIDDPLVRQLVDQAVEKNPDLQAAAHRLNASLILLAETGALRYPQLENGVSVNHHNQAFGADGEQKKGTNWNYSLQWSWEVDLWKRVASQHQANVALNQSQAADYAAARDVLAARVVQGWVSVVSLRQGLAVEKERIKLLTHLQNTIKRRYQQGIGNLEDLAAARASTELAHTEALAISDGLAQAVRNLEIMIGSQPRNELLVTETLPMIAQPMTGIPLSAVVRRPDVMAAHWRLQSADAQAAATARALMPAITLTGNMNKDLNPLADLLNGKTAWNLVGSLTQPLFDGGARRARAEAESENLEAVWHDYRAVLVLALSEVENGLSKETTLLLQLGHLRRAEKESQRNARIQKDRYRRGLVDIMTVLQAQNQDLDTRRQVLATNGELLLNRVDLALAIGAGLQENK